MSDLTDQQHLPPPERIFLSFSFFFFFICFKLKIQAELETTEWKHATNFGLIFIEGLLLPGQQRLQERRMERDPQIVARFRSQFNYTDDRHTTKVGGFPSCSFLPPFPASLTPRNESFFALARQLYDGFFHPKNARQRDFTIYLARWHAETP